MRNIIVDFFIMALCSALLFYLAFQSVAGAQYSGTGFQYSNQGLMESGMLLVIFALGLSRLVIDLRSR